MRRSGLELTIGKFHQFLTELYARHTSVFSFLGVNMSKYQWNFAELGMCFDIVETWFAFANGKILSVFERGICPPYDNVTGYYHLTFLFSNNI